MRHTLTRHPDYPCEAVKTIDVEVERPALGRLTLRYRLGGVTSALRLPPPSSGRADGLWKHTCLEAFVQPCPGDSYRELNLSPGGQWQAYRFRRYREGMEEADMGPPRISGGPDDLIATWDLDLPPRAPWRLGLSGVIEEAGGRISYWALAHPPGRPDFHNADCFTLELPAPVAP